MSFNITSVGSESVQRLGGNKPAVDEKDVEVREAFDAFVGEVFFSQMLKSMRKTVGEPAYFHGGQAEKTFTSQLDQVLAEQLTKATAQDFSGPMFELFTLQRS